MAAAVSEEPVDPADELMFLALGGGNEVGRSCHIIQYKGKTVMVRCHHHPHPHPHSPSPSISSPKTPSCSY
jgi:cleavage and polyadenylation specificity factor subunit 3